MLIVGRKLPNLCKKVALCRLGNLTWRLRKIKRRFGKIKRRFDRLKHRFILPVSQSAFCKKPKDLTVGQKIAFNTLFAKNIIKEVKINK